VTVPVEASGQVLADLQVAIVDLDTSACATEGEPPRVDFSVTNTGAVDVFDVQVAFYAGDPVQGGYAIHQVTVAGPVASGGGSFEVLDVLLDGGTDLPGFPSNVAIILYAVVDPAGQIPECNPGNNVAHLPIPAICETPE